MKKIHRFNQVVSQTLGRSEKSDVLTGDLPSVDQRVAAMVKALEHTKKKLLESLRSSKAASKEDGNLEKRKKALDEYKFSQAVTNDANAIEFVFQGSLLSDVMAISGEALYGIVDEIVQYEVQMEQHVLEKLTKFHEDLRNINNQKEKLKKLVLDMDSARTRLNAAQSRGERTNEIQDELDNAEKKVESHQDGLACDLYALASKEVDMAVLFRMLLQIQMDFHRSALKRLEAAEPLVAQKIDVYPRRPVYGCPLEDHLRYSGREIAVVLEDCCSALVELGLKDEGLFRISGNAIKIRRLKTAFDAGEVDLGEFDRDPHSIAGALKLYLRELPDSLMTNNLYRDWMNAVSVSNTDSRLLAIKDVINKLPKCNYANLRYLVKFLAKLVENQHITKMSPQNLSIVVAPNIIRSTTDAEGFEMNNAHGTLVEILISNAHYFFPGEIRFTSPHVAALIDKTGGFLENGPMLHAAALTLNVAKAFADDSGPATESQLSPNKGSSKRPKPPAPPPPPAPTDHSKINAVPYNRLDKSQSNVPRPVFPEESVSSDDVDDFDFSPTDSAEETKGKQMSIRPVSYVPHRDTKATNQGSTGFVTGHRKTVSLDRPIRPPRAIPETVMNTSMERNKNGSGPRPFPKQDELDELLLAGFGEALGQEKKMDKTNQKPSQPQRPPLPNKMVVSAVCGQTSGSIQWKQDAPTTVRISESDESDDDEPVVTSMACENVYYDVPSTLRSSYQPTDNSATLVSVTKKQDDQRPTPSKRSTPQSQPDVLMRNQIGSTVDGNIVAQRRESLMKMMDNKDMKSRPVLPKPPPAGLTDKNTKM